MKNPKECFALVQNQTFFVLNELVAPACEDGAEPLTMHDATFSRFKVVIINEAKKAASANIPVSAMPGIFYNMEAAARAGEMKKPPSENPQSPAYTVKITAGTLRGKTPAQALAEKPENKELLNNQINWLKQNLARYPGNKVQINAIQEALELYRAGHLKKVTPAEEDTVIYQTGMRPLIRRKRADGKCFVYEISVKYSAGERPVLFEIRNYYAPVIQRDNGLLNVQAKDRADEQKNTFRLTMPEWLWFRHVIEAQMRTFENIQAPGLYKKAYAAEMANRRTFAADNRAAIGG